MGTWTRRTLFRINWTEKKSHAKIILMVNDKKVLLSVDSHMKTYALKK